MQMMWHVCIPVNSTSSPMSAHSVASITLTLPASYTLHVAGPPTTVSQPHLTSIVCGPTSCVMNAKWWHGELHTYSIGSGRWNGSAASQTSYKTTIKVCQSQINFTMQQQKYKSKQRQVWFIPSADKTRGCAGKTVRSLDNALPYLSALEVGCLQ